MVNMATLGLNSMQFELYLGLTMERSLSSNLGQVLNCGLFESSNFFELMGRWGTLNFKHVNPATVDGRPKSLFHANIVYIYFCHFRIKSNIKFAKVVRFEIKKFMPIFIPNLPYLT